MKSQISPAGFEGLGIKPAILEVMRHLQFNTPTPIQSQLIPAALAGRDILGIAQTGTGKTLAFGIPVIQRLLEYPGRALILVPTRELALQVDETIRKLGNPFNIRSVIVIGGMDMSTQVKLLKKETIRVIIATPGRLVDHLEQKTLDPAELKTVVLDEADRMLDMGFAPQVERLAKFFIRPRQTLFFSATMPDEVSKLAAIYMEEAVRIEAAPPGAAPEKIIQELYILHPDDKFRLLDTLLKRHRGRVLIFTRTKAMTRKLTGALLKMNYVVNELHSDRTQGQRRHALKGFKEGLYRILVATDIAARGIDVTGIELVVNFDLPDETENYVHRIGRTGRAGREGHAITFAAPREGADIRDIERLMKTTLNVVSDPAVPAQKFYTSSHEGKRKPVYMDAARHAAGRPQFKESTLKRKKS